MAYPITLESKLWSDPRFSQLQILLGSRRLAIGEVVDAWLLAQQCALDGLDLIPDELWLRGSFSDALFKSGLAERVEGGVYLSGARERNEWIRRRQTQRSAAGRKSAEARRERLGTAQPGALQTSNDSERLRTARSGENLGKTSPKEETSRVLAPERTSNDSERPVRDLPNDTEQSLLSNLYSKNTHTHTDLSRKKTERITLEDMGELLRVWQETLDHFRIPKQARLEEISIAKLLQRVGFEAARTVLIGQRYEQEYPNFKPSEGASVSRILTAYQDPRRRQIFDNLMTLGAKRTAPQAARGNREAIEASLKAWQEENKA